MSLDVKANVIALTNNCSDPTHVNGEEDRKIRCSALVLLLFAATVFVLLNTGIMLVLMLKSMVFQKINKIKSMVFL